MQPQTTKRHTRTVLIPFSLSFVLVKVRKYLESHYKSTSGMNGSDGSTCLSLGMELNSQLEKSSNPGADLNNCFVDDAPYNISKDVDKGHLASFI